MKLTPTKIIIALFLVFFVASGIGLAADKSLNVIVFGAHPDDPEEMGGTMSKFIQQGHNVCLVSLTNGNGGHYKEGGGPLAQRRYKEAQCSGAVIGATYIVCDVDDGKLMPTLENREMVIRLIREWNADIVISHRPNDYHPDHRNTGLLVRDAAYMVTVPNIVANTPHLRKNPVFMYSPDGFSVPTPFVPDVVVDITSEIEKKIDMYHCHTSQMYEWLPYNANRLEEVPEGDAARRAWLAASRVSRSKISDEEMAKLVEFYGKEKASQVKYVEALQVSEYGRRPSKEELKELFPFFN